MDIQAGSFVWDLDKEMQNIKKHCVSFRAAARAFRDPQCRIMIDLSHSGQEQRFFCLGRIGNNVLTVRFMWRDKSIRIIGAGYWRKGRRLYEGPRP